MPQGVRLLFFSEGLGFQSNETSGDIYWRVMAGDLYHRHVKGDGVGRDQFSGGTLITQ